MLKREELKERMNEVYNNHHRRQSEESGGPRYFDKDLINESMVADSKFLSELYALLKDHYKVKRLEVPKDA